MSNLTSEIGPYAATFRLYYDFTSYCVKIIIAFVNNLFRTFNKRIDNLLSLLTHFTLGISILLRDMYGVQGSNYLKQGIV